MKVLVLGSGGREDALTWGLSRSPSVSELVAMPGNPGMARYAELLAGDPSDPDTAVTIARAVGANLVVVGPEAPLVAGVADALREAGMAVFGPDRGAAEIEGSKAHAKKLMDDAAIATAAWEAFQTLDGAIAKLDELGPPYVVKADGLAAGKGVVVTEDREAAIEAARECLSGERFGDAGRTVVIEEYLDGEEASVIAFTDGTTVVACEPAQDHKRVFDDDQGPNTGGMGSYSPVPACPPALTQEIVETILEPMVAATAGHGHLFSGALYAGLALTGKGPRVIEFNARFGDPETQALIPRLSSDLGEVCLACARGTLEGTKLEWTADACVSVVLASGGYPGPHSTGYEITGIEEAEAVEGVHVFHAGTRFAGDRLVTSGGRVLAVSALGPTYREARERAYAAAGEIRFEGKHLRRDIARRGVASEEGG